jgi:hypothetical protein
VNEKREAKQKELEAERVLREQKRLEIQKWKASIESFPGGKGWLLM